jgi:mono/diheme cytochrome c family protein
MVKEGEHARMQQMGSTDSFTQPGFARKVRSPFLTMVLSLSFLPGALCYSQGAQTQTSATNKAAAMAEAGQNLFNQKCLVCHSVNEGQQTLGPSLYREMKRPHSMSAAEIRIILKNGKGKMPSFANKLSKEDADNLLAYLRTL